MPLPDEIGLQAIVTVFPRPNQAFWTLSALWSGWLWGREAALPMRNVLDRRRYDWNWHTSALHSALAALSRAVPADTPFFGLLPDLAPGFMTAVMAALEAAGFHLEGLALQVEDAVAQGLWRPASHPEPLESRDRAALESTAREAIRAALIERAEPAPYLALYAAGMIALARERAIPATMPGMPGEVFTRLHAALARPFSDRSFLKFYPSSGSAAAAPAEPAEDERGWWWLASGSEPYAEAGRLPLSDRVEMEVVRFLQKRAACTLADLQQALAPQFTGLLVPSTELLRACLDSYAEPVANQPGAWRLRAGESPAERRADLHAMRAALLQIGRQLGYHPAEMGETTVIWEPDWAFYLMASSIISRFVLSPTPGTARRRVLVLPGSRSRLLTFKLRRDPRLAAALRGWRILKFRHLRAIAQQLSGQPQVDPNAWEQMLDQDPLTDEATQMPLFHIE